MKKIKKAFLIICLFFAINLQSATIIQEKSFINTPNFTEVLTFDKFNGPGNLTDVVVRINATGNLGQYAVDNDGVESGIFSSSFGLTGNITSPHVAIIGDGFQPALNELLLENSNVVFLEGNDGDGPNFDLGGADSIQFLPTTVFNSSEGSVSDFVFFMYEGSGTFDLNVAFNQFLDFEGAGGLRGSFSPSMVQGSVFVEYHTENVYDSLGLCALVLALLFLGLIAAKKRQGIVDKG